MIIRKEVYRALPDRLYRGDGTGHFVEVTDEAGLKADARRASGIAFCDFDNDGFVDIYVTCEKLKPNFLWRNQGDGTFQDVAEISGATAGEADSVAAVCMDYDHDGDFDLFVTNRSHVTKDKTQPASTLLRNEFVPVGELRFTDVTEALGLAWQPPPRFQPESAWISPAFADFNNDGWLDLFVSESCQGGKVHRGVPLKYGRLDSGYSKLYLNQAGQRFSRIDTDRNNLRIEDSWGAVAADYNNDGWLDLLVGSNTQVDSKKDDYWFDPEKQNVVLLRGLGITDQPGQTPDANHQYLNVTLTATDRAVAGAVVELTLDNGEKRRALSDTRFGGYTLGTNQLHFGLGRQKVKQIDVLFPGGKKAQFTAKKPWCNTSLLLDVSQESDQTPQVIERWP